MESFLFLLPHHPERQLVLHSSAIVSPPQRGHRWMRAIVECIPAVENVTKQRGEKKREHAIKKLLLLN